jgi:hypothetical protein
MAEITKNINFLQPSNFQISIDRKRYGNLTYFAQSINHPGATVNAVTMPVPRISSLSIAGDTISIDELSMDILVDEDMNSYVEMYEWLLNSVNKNYIKPHDRADTDVYIPEADITLMIMTSHNNVAKKITYIDCVPTSIGTLSMQSTLTEPQPLTFPITFKTSYFEIK